MNQRYSVRLENTGEAFPCREDQSVLLGMEALGRRGIPVGCRGGGCGVCKVHITEGQFLARKMSRACVSVEEEAAGVVLACKVFPRSDLVMSVIGKMTKKVCGSGVGPAPVESATDSASAGTDT